MTEQKEITVLIADDESHVRLLLKNIIKSMKAKVVGEAKNGQESIEMFKTLKPHITLLDINMPVKDGLSALQEIMSEFPQAFVIMMTSVADLETVEKCLDIGAAHYIRKDTPIEEMKLMIKKAWGEYRKQLERINV